MVAPSDPLGALTAGGPDGTLLSAAGRSADPARDGAVLAAWARAVRADAAEGRERARASLQRIAERHRSLRPLPAPGVPRIPAMPDAGTAVLRARLRDLEAENEGLRAALGSNRRMGMAIGVLMASRRLTAEQAFDALRTASSHANRKLRDVAEDVLWTGTLPAAGQRPRR
ncbi:ANTAR domain-containing protein [Geodermatophilus nigrescens]